MTSYTDAEIVEAGLQFPCEDCKAPPDNLCTAVPRVQRYYNFSGFGNAP